MTWFKVDDSFYDHPKVFDAPDCVLALWLRAGAWSARNLRDGFVPAKLPARLCDDPDTAVRELLDRGLWRRAKGGYQFHDWTDYQPTREEVERDRAAAAERQRRRRARVKGQEDEGTVTPPSRRDSRVSHTDSHGGSSRPPTRPVPSRKDGSSLGPHLQVADAPAKTDDDDQELEKLNEQIENRIIELLTEQTGRPVDRAWASRVRRQILDDRQVGNPLSYVAAAIRGEPQKYMPSSRPVQAGNAVLAQLATVDRDATSAATERGAPAVREAIKAAKGRKETAT